MIILLFISILTSLFIPVGVADDQPQHTVIRAAVAASRVAAASGGALDAANLNAGSSPRASASVQSGETGGDAVTTLQNDAADGDAIVVGAAADNDGVPVRSAASDVPNESARPEKYKPNPNKYRKKGRKLSQRKRFSRSLDSLKASLGLARSARQTEVIAAASANV